MGFAPRMLMGALAALLLAAAPATARAAAIPTEAAPGRTLFAVDGGRAELSAGVALPGGGAVLAGVLKGSGRVYIAKVSSGGALDGSFGSGGIAAVDANLAFEQILVQPDGRILLVGMSSRRGHFAELGWDEPHGYLVVERLNADGSIDRGYGKEGTARTTLEGGCYCHQIAVLTSAGELVVTGQQPVTVAHPWGSEKTHRWALARLTAAGSLDTGFGVGGVSVVAAERGVGLSIEASSGETLIAQGQAEVKGADGSSGPANLMTRIMGSGALDPAYAGGKPFALPVYAIDDSYGQTPEPLEALAEPDGRTIVETFPVPANPGRPKRDLGVGLVGYDASGALDRSFGYAGYLELEEPAEPSGSLLVGEPGATILAIHRRGSLDAAANPASVPGLLELERVTPTGRIDLSFAGPPGKPLRIPFGGGYGDPLPGTRYSYPEQTFTLGQNSFLGAHSTPEPLRMSDGSMLLAGNVSLTAPQRGGSSERTTNRFALAALTPQLDFNTATGAPAPRPALTVVAPPQTARRDVSRRGVALVLGSSAPGLARIDLYAGNHLLAHRLTCLLEAGSSTVEVPLSRRARRLLGARPHLGLRVTATFRDLFADGAAASAALRLR